jgi:hypothetical protein
MKTLCIHKLKTKQKKKKATIEEVKVLFEAGKKPAFFGVF